MVAETIDLCENFSTLVRDFDSEADAKRSDIRSYYLSECLLENPEIAGDNNLNSLIKDAVFKDRKEGAGFVSAMVKAYMKDGNIEHALSFFEQQIQSRRELKQNEEE